MTLVYAESTEGVNWDALRDALIRDSFHNGRTAEQYRRSFENSAAVVIAYHGEAIVGTARMLSDGVCNAYIVDVWTLSTHRRQGIATHMLRLLEAKAQGQHISLWTESAQDFYEHLGYHRSGDTLYEKVVGSWLRKSTAG
jgi:predicted GNAT family acetyltransferase